MIAKLLIPFVVLIFASVPIAFSQGLASLFLMSVEDVISGESFVKGITAGLNSFTLAAVPLFTFAGDIMGKGGISRRLLDLGRIVFDRFTGGLGMVAIVACMFFAAISGTGSATVAAIGLIMIPVMVNAGYDKHYSASLVATAGTIGTIIPPSVCMVVYAVAANASVTSLFTAGFPVGIITGIALCVYSYFVAKKRKYYPKEVHHYTGKEIWKIFVDAIPSLLIPVLVLGSIYGGICTPTEAAAFACFVGIIISCFVYKEVKISELPYLGFRAVMLCTPVLFVIGMSSGFGKVLAIADIPTMIAEAILGLTTNKILLLLLINILLLFVGAFMETNAAIIILTPILLPIVKAVGVSPVHFGMIMILNLAIGFITPPFGANLFMASEISNVKYTTLAKAIWPWIFVMVAVLMLVTYIPQISTFLPQLMGMSV